MLGTRAGVCSLYIYTTYIYLYMYCYEWFLLFLYNLWRKEEGWIGSNASTVETNWVAQRVFLKGIGSVFSFLSFFLSLLQVATRGFTVYGNKLHSLGEEKLLLDKREIKNFLLDRLQKI